MRKGLIFAAVAGTLMFAAGSIRAALDMSEPTEPKPIVIAGKVTVYPGGRVILRNVDPAKLPQIVIRADGLVEIDGSDTPAARP